MAESHLSSLPAPPHLGPKGSQPCRPLSLHPTTYSPSHLPWEDDNWPGQGAPRRFPLPPSPGGL